MRDSAAGPEVLLVRRHRDASAFAGASVFPGGTLDPQDGEPALVPDERSFLVRVGSLLEPELDRDTARAFAVAACREVFEETGILLARPPGRIPTEGSDRDWLREQRRRLHGGETVFRSILERFDLAVAVDDLVPFARWITPESQPRRWDTRFFLARAPEGQQERADGIETSSALWQTAAAALADYEAGRHVLAPPTYRILEGLTTFSDVDEALERSRRQAPPPTILPVPLEDAPETTLVYPGDRDYPGASGPALDRVVLRDGLWRSIRE